MNVQDLINKRASAWEAAKAFLDSHRNENGVLSHRVCESYSFLEN